MEKQSALYIAINKRKYRIENERKKVTNQQAAAAAKIAKDQSENVSNQLV